MKAKKTLKSRIRGWFPQEPKILGKTVQDRPNFAKRRLLFVSIILLLAVVLALAAFQIPRMIESTLPHEVGIHQFDSNLEIRGVINSIEENHRSDGWSGYHIYRYYLAVNISQVLWIDNDLAESINESKLFDAGKMVEIGYDYTDKPQLAVGQIIECKGYYAGYTDTIESIKLTIASAISESYLKLQI